MRTKRLLGIDVDGVCVDTLTLYKQASHHLEDPLDFWRDENLYDNLVPMDGAVEKLEQLSKYFGIVFVSRLKGNHHRSKVYFLKKFFPFMTGFIGTHEKYLLNESLVAMVDDLEDNLSKFEAHKRVLFGQGEYKDWNSFSVKDFCKDYLV
jgi:5'' nucleotidase, deoxy (Pyrimidine), cytosolic type C protein (NT5C).